MARTDNLTEFLEDVAGAIKSKKQYSEDTKIPAAEFDTEIESIETGIDTSDATAAANDIVVGKTAYIKGEKVTGTVPVDSGMLETVMTYVGQDLMDTTKLSANGIIARDNLYRSGNNVRVKIPKSNIANAENLTSEKIIEGYTVLGIEGTGKGGIDTSDATATADKIFLGETAYVKGEKITGTFDYDTCDELADNILGDLPIKEDTDIVLNVSAKSDISVDNTTLVIGG